MITTTVQHVSQRVEIQGAPSVPTGALRSSEDFQATFAASARHNTASAKAITTGLAVVEKAPTPENATGDPAVGVVQTKRPAPDATSAGPLIRKGDAAAASKSVTPGGAPRLGSRKASVPSESAADRRAIGQQGAGSDGDAANAQVSALAGMAPVSSSHAVVTGEGSGDKNAALPALSPVVASQTAPSHIPVAQDHAAAPLHRPEGVSERLPLSISGSTPSAETNKNIRQQVIAGPKGVSTQGGGIKEPGTPLPQHSAQSDLPSDAGASDVAGVATDGEPLASLPDAKSIADLSHFANATGAVAQTGAPALELNEGQALLPAKLTQSGAGASPALTATDKERVAKPAADEPDSSATVAQPTSFKGTLAAMPNMVGDTPGNHVGGAAPAAGSSATALVSHTATEVAAPVHAGNASVPANLNLTTGHAGGGIAAGLAVESSAAGHPGDSHRTLLATPTALEVGVQSGTQGWLKIRAEVSGQGEVKASLDAVSTSGRDLLHSQLPALNAFLHGEQMSVTASIAERSLAASVGADSAVSSGASSGSLLQSGGGQPDGRRGSNAGRSDPVENYDASGIVSDAAVMLPGSQANTAAENGRWLNVRV